MFWFIYNAVFAAAFTLMCPYFLSRMFKRGGYAADFSHRFGRYAPALRARLAEGGRVWIHAVSVGEFFVAEGLIQHWRQRDPGVRFVVSVTTSTGYALAKKRLDARDALIYFPIDLPVIMRRVQRLIRPRAIVLMETEIWPNLVRLAVARGIPVFLANGRLSSRSARGYARLGSVTRRILPLFRGVFMQSLPEAQRMIELGARHEAVHAVGTAKYDIALADAGRSVDTSAVRTSGPVLLGGSTWAGEEAALLDAYASLRARHAGLSLILAPRHVERRAAVVVEIEKRGLRWVARSAGLPQGEADVFLLDTTGELRGFYPCADVIFVGKSLCEQGGQNPIEPAAVGKAIVVGPHMENFTRVMQEFLDADGIVQIQEAGELPSAIASLLENRARRDDLGRAAKRVVEAGRGSIDRTLDVLLKGLA